MAAPPLFKNPREAARNREKLDNIDLPEFMFDRNPEGYSQEEVDRQLADMPPHCPLPPDNMTARYKAPPPPNEIGRALAKLELHMALLHSEMYIPYQQRKLREILTGARDPRMDVKQESKFTKIDEFTKSKTRAQLEMEKLAKRQRLEDQKLKHDLGQFRPLPVKPFIEDWKPDKSINLPLPELFANFQNITRARNADYADFLY